MAARYHWARFATVGPPSAPRVPVGIFELTWAPDGRATFEHGSEVRDGELHVIWRRIGRHDIFGTP